MAQTVMKKTILLPTLFLLLIANCQLIVAQSNFKNVERSSITNTDDASKKLNAQTIDNSLYQQNKAPVKAYIFDDTDALNEFTALRQGIKIVKDGESGLPIFIEGRIKNIQKSARSGRTSAEAMAFNYLASVKGILKLENPDESFEVKSVETDALGQNHIRLQQTYQGLSIYGGDLILHTEGNDVTTMNGRYFPTPYIQDITANVSQLEAENLALKDLATSTIVQPLTAGEKKILDYEKPQTELLIYHVKGNTEGERLAYRIEIHPNFLEHWVCFVDAKTGTVLRKYNNMCSVDGPNKATALDLNGVSRSLDTYLFKNTYFLLDAIRVGPDGKAMFKLPSSTMPDNPVGALLTLDAQNSSVSSQNLNLAHITSSNNAWSNKTAVSAHYNAAMAFEYYKTVHKRNSIDGKGGTIISIINITDDKGAQLDNAFWSDKIMVYGNGKTSFKPLAGGLDVAAHEMTHGVVQNSANLEYDSQSGAMNESMADIFGAMVDRKNWTMGEDVVKTNIFPSGALRDLSNPNQGGKNTRGYQPKNMNEYYTGEDDNSGVHINSGIPNWAFFKFATGRMSGGGMPSGQTLP